MVAVQSRGAATKARKELQPLITNESRNGEVGRTRHSVRARFTIVEAGAHGVTRLPSAFISSQSLRVRASSRLPVSFPAGGLPGVQVVTSCQGSLYKGFVSVQVVPRSCQRRAQVVPQGV